MPLSLLVVGFLLATPDAGPASAEVRRGKLADNPIEVVAVATTEGGQRVLLRADGTWVKDQEPPSAAHKVAILAKFADDAVSVWDKNLILGEAEFGRRRVELYLHFENKTDSRVIGILVKVTVKNPFGKTVLAKAFESEVVLSPMAKERNSTFWAFQDNQFINGEPFDLMWQIAKEGTAIIETEIRKVILEGGIVLEARPEKSVKKK